MEAADWLEDYERVKRAGTGSRATAARLTALDDALRVMARDPAACGLSRQELRRRRVMLDALGEAKGGESPAAYATRTVGARIEEQEALMRDQESAVAEIANGVAAVHELSYQLRDETHLQVGLLDDVNGDVEDAHAGLRKETRAAELFGKTGGECALYVTVAVNTFVIVALLFYGFRS